MKILIVSNGTIDNYKFYKGIVDEADYIICADGGARHLARMGVIPNIIIGDLDSINEKDKNFYNAMNVEFVKYPVKKDATDTEIATELALTKNPTEIIFIGTLGTRMDHTLSNIFLLVKLLKYNVKGRIINETNEIYIIEDTISLNGNKEEFLSILPISNSVSGVTLKGLEYPLENAEISLGSSIGISNKFLKNHATVEIEEGSLIVVKSRD